MVAAPVGIVDVVDASEGLSGVRRVSGLAVGVPGIQQAPRPAPAVLGDVLGR